MHASPHFRVLVVTMFEDDRTVFSPMLAGARGYVLKGAMSLQMAYTIQAMGSGEVTPVRWRN